MVGLERAVVDARLHGAVTGRAHPAIVFMSSTVLPKRCAKVLSCQTVTEGNASNSWKRSGRRKLIHVHAGACSNRRNLVKKRRLVHVHKAKINTLPCSLYSFQMGLPSMCSS